jgi:hypothetical protein
MKRHTLVITALLFIVLGVTIAVASTNIDGEQYIVVVAADAPASDVVLGANFAASMKGSTAVTFASAIDTDARARLSSVQYRTIVVIDGRNKKVKVLGESDTADAAELYWERQGFAVQRIRSPVLDDVLVVASAPTDDAAVDAQVDEEIVVTGPQPVTFDPPEERKEQDDVDASAESAVTAGASEPSPPPAPSPVSEPEEPGFFARVFAWFGNLF